MGTTTTLVHDESQPAVGLSTTQSVSRAGYASGFVAGPTRPSEGSRRSPMTLGALADLASGLARVRGLWGSRAASLPRAREGLRLLATDRYEAWLLAWPPGSSVEPHDHGDASGAFVVCTGELAEIRWTGRTCRTRWLAAGDVATVPAGAVHDVVSVGSGSALSIHAYSPPLRKMRFYDRDARRVIAVEPVVEEATLLDARVAAALVHSANRG